MVRVTFFLIAFSVSITVVAQTASEIYLFDISAKKDKITISNPMNVTNHKGYDNQPSFHPRKPSLYYSSFNEDGRADILTYDYKANKSAAVTQTPEREYSPTVTPDGENLSCIIQRDNNAQDLGKYPIHGGPASVILDHLIVGYHVWADNSHLALFILGTPQTLHYLRLPTKKDTILAQDIGRSLHRIPGQAAISFVQKTSGTDWMIKRLDTQSMVISSVASTLPGRDDLCWLPDGRILMSDGNQLFFLTPGKGQAWTKVNVVGGHPFKGITRLAISGDGKKLAIVADEE